MNNIDKLKKMAQACSSCQSCPLHKKRLNVVWGAGTYNCKILVIAEAPGKSEDEQGQPFRGATGRVLNELLSSVDLKQTDIFFSNIVKCRPPKNRNPLKNEVQTCTKLWLIPQIKLLKPQIIIILGGVALNYFYPQMQLKTAHGLWHTWQGYPVLILYHPASSLYRPSLRTTLFADIQQIKTYLKQN